MDKKLEDIHDTAKDPNVIMQYVRSTIKFYISKFTPSFSITPRKFTKILQLDQLMYGTADEAKRPLTSSAPSTRQASGTATITGNKRKWLQWSDSLFLSILEYKVLSVSARVTRANEQISRGFPSPGRCPGGCPRDIPGCMSTNIRQSLDCPPIAIIGHPEMFNPIAGYIHWRGRFS